MSARLDFRSLAKHRLLGCHSRADELRIGRRLKKLVARRLMETERARKEAA
jgi:hypothetical protein